MLVCKEPEHHDTQCEHYCNNCKKLVCIFCTQIGKHSTHCCCTSAQAVAQCKNRSADKLDEKIKKLSEGYLKIEMMDTEIQKQGGDI